MKKKSILAALFAGMLSIGMLGGCGGSDTGSGSGDASTASTGGDASGKKTTFTVTICGATLEDGINPTTKREAEGLNTYAKNQVKEAFPDIDVVFNSIPWDNVSAKMQTTLMSNGTDLFTMGGAFIPEYYKEGLMQSLNPFLEADTEFVYEDVFPANFKTHPNCTSYDGKDLLTLPWAVGNRIIIYDKQIFDDWGVEYLSENPTPEELLEKAAKMTGKNPKTGVQNYGLYMAANTTNMDYVVPLSEAFGATECTGDFSDPANLQWSLNSPEMVETLQWIVDAMKFVPQAASTGQGAEKWGTTENDIAIYFDGNGVSIMNNYWNTKDESLLERFEPTMNLGNNGGNWTPVDGMGMAAHLSGDDAQTAWELLKFMTSDDTQKWYYEQFGPSAVPNLIGKELYDPKDKYMVKNSEIMAQATHPGYEINPFFGSNIQPTWASMFSRSIAGEDIDVQGELDQLQQKAEEWSASQK